MFGFGQQQASAAPCDKYDDDFRRKRVWHSFKAVLFSGLSAAAFIGVMNKLVDFTITAVKNGVVGAFGETSTLAVMGAFMAAGVAATWMAQNSWTEVKCMEDERLARKNAEMMNGKTPAQEKTKTQEYEQNQRADGKQWREVVTPGRAQQLAV